MGEPVVVGFTKTKVVGGEEQPRQDLPSSRGEPEGGRLLSSSAPSRVEKVPTVAVGDDELALLVAAQRRQALGVLLEGGAQDVSDLLWGVLGHADLALRMLPAHAPAAQQVQKVVATARQSGELFQQLLALSGPSECRPSLLDLGQLVLEMAPLINMVVSRKAAVDYRLKSGLPPVWADAGQLRLVLLNLVVNAREALGDQKGSISVTTEQHACSARDLADTLGADQLAPGPYVALLVSDSGGGIAPEFQGKLFDPSFSTKGLGRGLGLAAVLGIVRSHAGGIKVISQKNQGATFAVYLPVHDGVAERPEQPVARTSQGKVLVVDDEPNALKVAELFLEEVGYTVVTAYDGEQALTVYRAHPHDFAAVVLDLTMPRMGGQEVFDQLRALRPELPVIFSSGYSEEELAERLTADPRTAFIQKPYRFAALIEQLEQLLNLS
jgi:signal transduction histidine kinase